MAICLALALAGWVAFEESLKEVFLIRLIGVLAFWLGPAGLGWVLWRAWRTGELSIKDLSVRKVDEPVRFWVDFLCCVFLLAVLVVIGIVGGASVLLDG